MRRKRTTDGAAKRREEIIKVAARIFAAKGYEATTLDEIAAEIGVTKPALYYHISSKEELLHVLVAQIMKLREEVTKLGHCDLPPKERLEAMIRMLVGFPAENGEATRIAFEQATVLPKRTRDAFRRRQKEVEHALQKTLSEGIEGGDFDINNIRMASFAILGACNWVYHWHRREGELNPEK